MKLPPVFVHKTRDQHLLEYRQFDDLLGSHRRIEAIASTTHSKYCQGVGIRLNAGFVSMFYFGNP